MVRVFRAVGAADASLAGVIEHIGTGWSTPFTTADELVSSIQAWLEPDSTPPGDLNAQKRSAAGSGGHRRRGK